MSSSWRPIKRSVLDLTSACDDADCVGSGFERVDVTYDGEGHRTAISVDDGTNPPLITTFRYQGDAIAAEYLDGDLVREYVTDDTGTISKVIIPPGEAEDGTYLVTWNGHGDAMALYRMESNGSLTLANSYTYSTWGSPTTATHNGIADLGFRFLYVGAADVQWDASLGLHYMHARHYSPTLGRFLQPDPSRLDAQLFVYAGNGPVSRVDPSGLRVVYLLRRTTLLTQDVFNAGAAVLCGLLTSKSPLKHFVFIGLATAACGVAGGRLSPRSGDMTAYTVYKRTEKPNLVYVQSRYLFASGSYYHLRSEETRVYTATKKCVDALIGSPSAKIGFATLPFKWYCLPPYA